MIDDEGALATLLSGTFIGGRPVHRVRLPDGEPDAFLIHCSPHEIRSVWDAGRSIVEDTGRWPVMTTTWGDSIQSEVRNRFAFHHGSPGPATTIPEIVRRACSVDPDSVISELARRNDEHDASGSLPYTELPYTSSAAGDAPHEAEIRAALGDRATHATLDLWLLDWERRHGVADTTDETDHLAWYEPEGQEAGMLLLPTPNSWETAAYLSFFGAEGPGGAEKLVAMLRRWHDQFGAELVAHYGVMLQFVVRRPPSTLDVAWQLAREQELIAQCTTMLPGVPLRHHARALVGRDTWFLFERP